MATLAAPKGVAGVARLRIRVFTVFASALAAVVLADLLSAAVLTSALAALVLADTRSVAVFTLRLDALVLAAMATDVIFGTGERPVPHH